MKDLIAKLQLDANVAMGAIWLHIDEQQSRIAKLEEENARLSASWRGDATVADALEERVLELEAENEELRAGAQVVAEPEWADGRNDDPAEAAFWRFDARKKGYGRWKGASQSERDAFKAEYRAAASTAVQAPVREVPEPNPDRVEWIVNDMGELGVRVDNVCYFCYKGESLVYENGKHDDGTPILHRNVGKREFGECVWPAAWYERGHRDKRYNLELVYTPGLSFGPPDNPKYKWLPLPAAPVQESKP